MPKIQKDATESNDLVCVSWTLGIDWVFVESIRSMTSSMPIAVAASGMRTRGRRLPSLSFVPATSIATVKRSARDVRRDCRCSSGCFGCLTCAAVRFHARSLLSRQVQCTTIFRVFSLHCTLSLRAEQYGHGVIVCRYQTSAFLKQPGDVESRYANTTCCVLFTNYVQ